VSDLLQGDTVQFRRLAPMRIQAVEQGIERRAEIEAATAPVTNLIDPPRFLLEACAGDSRRNEIEPFHLFLMGTDFKSVPIT
jgi:hypothetical protein